MAFTNWQLQPSVLFAMGPVVPVIVIKDLADAVPMAKALLAGGIKVLEVTLRTPVALEAIKLLAEQVPDAVVGAGTVTNPEQLAQVAAAGAKFAISPGSNLRSSLILAALMPALAGWHWIRWRWIKWRFIRALISQPWQRRYNIISSNWA